MGSRSDMRESPTKSEQNNKNGLPEEETNYAIILIEFAPDVNCEKRERS
jgi:hypothetical protein